MTRNKLMGLMSILLIIPSTIGLIPLLIRFPYLHPLIAKQAIIITSGILGGILLIRQNRLGYIFLCLAFVLVTYQTITQGLIVIAEYDQRLIGVFVVRFILLAYETTVELLIILFFLKELPKTINGLKKGRG